jgi:hypothetical protein
MTYIKDFVAWATKKIYWIKFKTLRFHILMNVKFGIAAWVTM